MRFFRWRERLRSSLWLVPTLCVLAAAALALGLIELDRRYDHDFTFRAGPDGAHTFLSTVSSSMITLTGLVFSITIVVLQLASQQFSPRVLRTFLRDRHSQFALGVFIATFTYALIVLRTVRSEDAPGGAFVPDLSVTVAFGLVMLSLALFVDYIHHISQSIRVASITRAIAQETREIIEDIYDHDRTEEHVPLPTGSKIVDIPAPGHGVLTGLDRDDLVAAAESAGCILEVVPMVGDYIPEGRTLVRIHGGEAPSPETFTAKISIDSERTMKQDAAFGFRQLVDIAQRGLSPAVNDPTTAVQCLDEIHDLLRRLAARPFPSGQRRDSSGQLRLVFPVISWEGYVSLACDEIRHYGRGSIQVHRRLRWMLNDLLSVAPEERHGALRRQLRLLDESADKNLDHEDDRVSAKQSDEQGIGGI